MVTPVVSSKYQQLYQQLFQQYVKYLVLISIIVLKIYCFWTTLVVLEVR
jgi:hypothetical protein